MLTLEEALDRARAKLSDLAPGDAAGELVIVEEFTREYSRGWAFQYNTTLWVQTRNRSDGVAGNGPIFVDKESGAVYLVPTGGAKSWLEEYDRTGAPPPPPSGPLKWVGTGPAVSLQDLGLEHLEATEDPSAKVPPGPGDARPE